MPPLFETFTPHHLFLGSFVVGMLYLLFPLFLADFYTAYRQMKEESTPPAPPVETEQPPEQPIEPRPLARGAAKISRHLLAASFLTLFGVAGIHLLAFQVTELDGAPLALTDLYSLAVAAGMAGTLVVSLVGYPFLRREDHED